MRYTLVSLFPEWFVSPLASGLLGKAVEKGIVEFHQVNPRDFTEDRHRTVDDRPYGGGPGMVLLLEPLLKALRSLPQPGRLLALTPGGRPFTQALARELAAEPALTLICGRYEGFDARLFDLLPVEPISVGDFVLNGGECGALALIEATARLLPGFMGKEESGDEESFSHNLLEYPQYTRPENFEAIPVPSPLLTGDHGLVARWRRQASLETTFARRPDLLQQAVLSTAERDALAALPRFRPGKNLSLALLHHPVLLKDRLIGTSSLTNLDVHDIARSSRTYGLGGLHVVTPLEDQRRLLETLVHHWVQGAGAQSNPDRAKALALVNPAASLDEAIEACSRQYGVRPYVVGTSARPLLDKKGREKQLATPFPAVREKLETGPVLLLLGTSHGLAPQVLEQCDAILPPLRWADRYNHLPVRAAAAIMLDRLLGDIG